MSAPSFCRDKVTGSSPRKNPIPFTSSPPFTNQVVLYNPPPPFSYLATVPTF